MKRVKNFIDKYRHFKHIKYDFSSFFNNINNDIVHSNMYHNIESYNINLDFIDKYNKN